MEDLMRILAIRDIVAPIRSQIANAYIDFSAMTASVLAIVTDRVVDGRPVVGFGFNSNGRYAPQGLLRERFIPRLMSARPEEIQGDGGFIDPHKAWGLCMRNASYDGFWVMRPIRRRCVLASG
jgi:D(-)-tartrate dehydratase